MKRILSIFIFLLLCYPSYAMNVVMMSGEGTSAAAPSGVAVDAVSTNYTAGANASITWSHTTGTGSNRALFVGAYVGNADNSISGITYNGDALTEVYDIDGADNFNVAGWILVNPDSGTHDVVITYVANREYTGGYAISFTGVDQDTPTGTPVTSYVFSTGTSNDVTAATNDIVVDTVIVSTGTPSIGTGQTEIYTQGDIGGRYYKGSREAGAATTTMSWTGDSGNWVAGAVAIKKAD